MDKRLLALLAQNVEPTPFSGTIAFSARLILKHLKYKLTVSCQFAGDSH